jgi:hypothetical protein
MKQQVVTKERARKTAGVVRIVPLFPLGVLILVACGSEPSADETASLPDSARGRALDARAIVTSNDPNTGNAALESTDSSDPLALLAALLPAAHVNQGAFTRGFEATQDGVRTREPSSSAAIERWLTFETDRSGRATTYRFRQSPHVFFTLVPEGDALLRPPVIEGGGAYLASRSPGSWRLHLATDRRVEEFELVTVPRATVDYSYRLQPGPGIGAVEVNSHGHGEVLISDEAGVPTFVIRVPEIIDATGAKRAMAWHLAPEGAGRSYFLSASFTASDLSFPLVVDPTVEVPTWIKKAPLVKPPALYGEMLAYDSVRQRVVLFGGKLWGGDMQNDVWEWNGTIWDNRTPAGTKPSPRQFAAFVFDPTIAKTVLHAGYICGAPDATTTWGWNGSAWSVLPNTGAPPCTLNGMGQTFDTMRSRVVLFGDWWVSGNEVYEYQGGVGWSHPNPGTRPPGRGLTVLFFDSVLGRSVTFSGNNLQADTWGWNGVNWVQYNPTVAPAARDRAHAAWDSDRSVGLLYGGASGCCTDYPETWEWSSLSWKQVTTSSRPQGIQRGAMAYDAARKEAVFFGGWSIADNAANDETWVYKVLQLKTAGEPCAQAAECLSGFCVDSVCCNSACGGGSQADCEACSLSAGAVTDGTCGPVMAAANQVCRASAGVCDIEEKCDGVSIGCGADSFQPSSYVCRQAADVCDKAETCTGSSILCPSDSLSPAGTVCRATVGACDAVETCTGSSMACPADVGLPAGTVCRNTIDACDLPEVCSGQPGDCPIDALKPAGTPCRAVSGSCDQAESCDGTSKACPADAFKPAGLLCRAAAGTCDAPETCTGTGPVCPTDTFKPSNEVCRPATNVCDLVENCSGQAAICPPDALAPNGQVCDDMDPCTVGEACELGSCSGGVPLNCDDMDPCTIDSCAKGSGCQHSPLPGCLDGGSQEGGSEASIDEGGGGSDGAFDSDTASEPDLAADAPLDAPADSASEDGGGGAPSDAKPDQTQDSSKHDSAGGSGGSAVQADSGQGGDGKDGLAGGGGAGGVAGAGGAVASEAGAPAPDSGVAPVADAPPLAEQGTCGCRGVGNRGGLGRVAIASLAFLALARARSARRGGRRAT